MQKDIHSETTNKFKALYLSPFTKQIINDILAKIRSAILLQEYVACLQKLTLITDVNKRVNDITYCSFWKPYIPGIKKNIEVNVIHFDCS